MQGNGVFGKLNEQIIQLRSLEVFEPYRRHGYGRKIISQFEDMLAKERIKKIILIQVEESASLSGQR